MGGSITFDKSTAPNTNLPTLLTDLGLDGTISFGIANGTIPAPGTEGSLTLQGSFLSASYSAIAATVTVDLDGTFSIVTLVFPSGPDFFTVSFPNMPVFTGLPDTVENKCWLDQLGQTNAVLVMASTGGTVPMANGSPFNYIAGLNYACVVTAVPGASGDNLGILPVSVPKGGLVLGGPIIPEPSTSPPPWPPLPPGAGPWQPDPMTAPYPIWQTGLPPGAYLAAPLGGPPKPAESWAPTLSNTFLMLYSPLTKKWLATNGTYAPTFATIVPITDSSSNLSSWLTISDMSGSYYRLTLSTDYVITGIDALTDLAGGISLGQHMPKPISSLLATGGRQDDSGVDLAITMVSVLLSDKLEVLSLSIAFTVTPTPPGNIKFSTDVQFDSVTITVSVAEPFSEHPAVDVVVDAVLDVLSTDPYVNMSVMVELTADTSSDFTFNGMLVGNTPTLGEVFNDLPDAIANLDLQAADISYSYTGGSSTWSMMLLIGDENSSVSSGLPVSELEIQGLQFNAGYDGSNLTWSVNGTASDGGVDFLVAVSDQSAKAQVTFPPRQTISDLLTKFGATSSTDTALATALEPFAIALDSVLVYHNSGTAIPGTVFMLQATIGGSTIADVLLCSMPGSSWSGILLDIQVFEDLCDVPLIAKLAPNQRITIEGFKLCYASGTSPASLPALLSAAGVAGAGANFDNAPAGLSLGVGVGVNGTVQWTTVPLTSSSPSSTRKIAHAGDTGSSVGGATQWMTVNRQLGPLDLQQIGVGVTGGTVTLAANASLALGPMTVDLAGFGITASVTGPLDPQLTLNGIEITYQSGPTTISGMVMALKPPLPQDVLAEYAGSLTIATDSFDVSAFGSYAVMTDGSVSLMAAASVADDFGGPPFFTVTGLCLGFGMNRELLLPPVSQIADFPLVQVANGTLALDGPSGLAQVETALDDYMAPTEGTDWLAAGVTFTSYGLAEGVLMLAVVDGVQVQIDLFGTISLVLPPDVSTPRISATLGVEATYTPAAGTLTVLGQLQPNAYVLDPSCALSGGFAVAVWFDNSQHPGDFVVTLGGYDPNFEAPIWYPTVPRLGINWKEPNSPLAVTGSAYFAVAPHCLMLGMQMQAVWQSGSTRAWFATNSSFLIGWSPFSYQASLGVAFGVSTPVDLGLVTLDIEVTISAQLALWGTPFGGMALIDLSVISFTIDFGTPAQTPEPLGFSDFASAFLPPGSTPAASETRAIGRGARNATAARLADATANSAAITIVAATGTITPPTPPVNPPNLIVDPETATFMVTLSIPATQVTLINGQTKVVPSLDGAAIGIPAMNCPSATSAVTITATVTGGASSVVMTATAQTGNVSGALWASNQNYPPTVDLNGQTFVTGAVTGVLLVPADEQGYTFAAPWTTDQIDVLLFSEPLVFTIAWPTPGVATAPVDASDASETPIKTLITTIDTSTTQTARNDVLADLVDLGFSVPSAVDASLLTRRRRLLMADDFRLASLGAA